MPMRRCHGKMEATQWAWWLAVVVTCLCVHGAAAIGSGGALHALAGSAPKSRAEWAISSSGSRPSEELHTLFVEAQRERQRRRYAQAGALYEAVAAYTVNAPVDHRQLRMWVQYQHADLLMRHVVAQVERDAGRVASDSIKVRAIAKFQDALQLSMMVNGDQPIGYVAFGTAEREHAHNSVGTLATELGRYNQAIESFQRAISADPAAYAPLGNLALVLLKVGRLEEAQEINNRALALKPDDSRLLHNMGTIFFELGEETQAESYWLEVLEDYAESVETLTSLATLYGSRGDAERAQNLVARAEDLTPSGTLQHSIRLQRAMSHLRMIYSNLSQITTARDQFKAALASIRLHGDSIVDPLTTIGSGSLGYYAIYQGYHDRDIRLELAQIYRESCGDGLNFVAPHVRSGRAKRFQFIAFTTEPNSSSAGSTVTVRRRIRVGFLSAFLRHHSVGLLISGVMRHLRRDQFEVVAIIFDDMGPDAFTATVLDAADQTIRLPARDLRRSQRLISSLELDILVFSEIGMHAATYFLAFAKLALRSVAFWGHAVTSGIDTVDYFVSSKLFRQYLDKNQNRRHYTECLYEMEGLTTLFPRPPTPAAGLTRMSFGLPSASVLPHMLLIPQTLYKLHPDFDIIIQRVLSTVKSIFLVLPVGDKPLLVQQLTRRWREGGIIDNDVYKRIFFVRQMNATEFLALCEMSDLVLDPFPVGGGRSSFEVFSVGTPILGVTSRTTILQLTLTMYRRMAIDTTCCMFETEDEIVTEAVDLLRNTSKRLALRDQILRNNHKLYAGSNHAAVREWEHFLKQILSNDAPGRLLEPDPNERCESVHHGAYSGSLKPQLEYELSISTGIPTLVVQRVQLFEGDDPFRVASLVTNDILQVAYLGKLLWNMQTRFVRRVVDLFEFVSSAGSTFVIDIREGDDLHQVIRWQVMQALGQAANLRDIEAQVLQHAVARVPQHTESAWRAARAMVPPRSFMAPSESSRRDCIALVVTTCKRLALFLRTMASLRDALGVKHDDQWYGWFCSIVVIDDTSSDEDRLRMREAYPSFRFVWKSPLEKGHARSLNWALRHIRDVRFVFYLEDDWEFRKQHSPGCFLLDAIEVLRSSPLAQVLLNDQRGGHASQHTAKSGHTIQYAAHEFAVADPAHEFSYWPGFSLNPGVWDLDKLSVVFPEVQDIGDQHIFDEDTDIFEREFSLRVWRSGLEVGYLKHGDVCDHIGAAPGTNASAYVLNGLPRRFDLAFG